MDPSPLREPRVPKAAGSDNVPGTVLLLITLILVAAFLSFRGMFLGYWVDACGVVTVPCKPELLRAGLLTGLLSPWAIVVIAVPLAITLMILHRRSVWVPLVAVALTVAFHILAVVLVDVALQPQQLTTGMGVGAGTPLTVRRVCTPHVSHRLAFETLVECLAQKAPGAPILLQNALWEGRTVHQYRTLPLWAMGGVLYLGCVVILLACFLIAGVRGSVTYATPYSLLFATGVTIGELSRVAGARRRAGGADAFERVLRAVQTGTVPVAVNTDRWISVLTLQRDRLRGTLKFEPIFMAALLLAVVVFFVRETPILWVLVVVGAAQIVWRLATAPRTTRVMTAMLAELTRRSDAPSS